MVADSEVIVKWFALGLEFGNYQVHSHKSLSGPSTVSWLASRLQQHNPEINLCVKSNTKLSRNTMLPILQQFQDKQIVALGAVLGRSLSKAYRASLFFELSIAPF